MELASFCLALSPALIKLGIAIGDRIPIIADIWPKKDGGVWEFDIVGTYINKKNDEQDEAFINWKYFDEARIYETGRPGNFIVKVKDPEIKPTSASHEIFLRYQKKSIFSIPIATTPAAEPIINILPPVPAQYARKCHN